MLDYDAYRHCTVVLEAVICIFLQNPFYEKFEVLIVEILKRKKIADNHFLHDGDILRYLITLRRCSQRT